MVAIRLLKKAMKMGDGKAHWEMANLLEDGDETDFDMADEVEIEEPDLEDETGQSGTDDTSGSQDD